MSQVIPTSTPAVPAWPTAGGDRPPPLLAASPTEFQQSFNRMPFTLRHSLAASHLFELPRLTQLAQRMLQRGDTKNFVALGGQSAADTRFSAMAPQERLAGAVSGLAGNSSWLKLSSADAVDSEYAGLLAQILEELEGLAAIPLRRQITWSGLTVFLASPHIVTPYHIDHESNFLFQLQGEKDLSLFDQDDRDILSEPEIEDFYAGNYQAARYREHIQARAKVYRLVPGLAVHHPPLAPHWVRNGNNVSVSVSIGFCLGNLDRRARVYQINRYLRRLRLQPRPPGQSRLADAWKIATIGLISKSHPSDREEILFSGVERLKSLNRRLKSAAGAP